MSTLEINDDTTGHGQSDECVDALIIGAGFGGLYALHKLRDELGLNVQVVEMGSDVGGTWYWNTFPGARSDSGAAAYCFSFDESTTNDWEWSERFPAQPEIERYFQYVAKRHDFYRNIRFNTRVVSTQWDDVSARWRITAEDGSTWTAKFLIEGLGVLTRPNVPNYPGQERFKGEVYHSALWPRDETIDLSGKRVGIIGSGSTGVQILTAIAPAVGQLYTFQRTPQWILPAGHGEFDAAVKAEIKADHDGFFKRIRATYTGFGWPETATMMSDVDPDAAVAAFEEQWNRGGSLQFMGGVFADLLISENTNKTATDFIAGKIRQIVKDPDLAEQLIPAEPFARRPIQEDGYYEIFNRDNVSFVGLREEPIVEITESGVVTSKRTIELDVLIYATGFDAHTGAYLAIDQRGKDGIELRDRWAERPRTFMAAMTAGFPNWFMTLGPMCPFANYPQATYVVVDWFTELIKHVLDESVDVVEVSAESEDAWMERCDSSAAGNFLMESPSWLNGGNIPGKKRVPMLFFGGMNEMDAEFRRLAAQDYPGLGFRSTVH